MIKIEPLVSVVIPVYNVKSFLTDCVDSVIKQSYKNIEIILVDDGSTDGSGDICDKYSQEHSNIISVHQKNAGLSEARNTGIKAATGKYIYFLDSDDFIVEDAIRLLVTEAEHYNSDFVFFDASVIDEVGNPLDDNRYIRKQNYVKLTPSTEMFKDLVKNKDYFPCATMLFIKREALGNLLFEKGVLYEDILFTFSLFLNTETSVHLPMQLYVRRIRENSITQLVMKERNITSLCIIINKILELYKKEKDAKRKDIILTQVSNLYGTLINYYCYLSKKDKRNCRKALLQTLNELEINGIKNRRLYEYVKHYSFRYFNKSFVSTVVSIVRNINSKSPHIKYLKGLCSTKNKKNIFLLGTPLHGNLGDHLIAEAEKQFFEDFLPQYNFVDIPMPVYSKCKKKLKSLVCNDDIIVISGGGWLGNLWLHNENYVRNMIKSFPNNKIIIMPQTIFYEDNENGRKEMEITKEIYNSHKDLRFCLRDKKSYDYVTKHILKNNNFSCYLLPDMALTYKNDLDLKDNRKDALVCFRKDREKVLSDEEAQKVREYIWSKGLDTWDTTTVYLYGISLKQRKKAIESKIMEYSKAKIIVTDRLHSMIFAAISHTPCVALDNVTAKVSGVYEWIKNLKYIKLAKNAQEAIVMIDELLCYQEETEYKFNTKEHFWPLLNVFKGE